MKKTFSKNWISSKQPRKQRKYRINAPLHLKSKFLSAHLSADLRKKHSRRSIRARVGDKVKVLRGQFKNSNGAIEIVDTKKSRVYISKVEVNKKDGSKRQIPINISNVVIVDLKEGDKKRKIAEKIKENKKENKDGKKTLKKISN